MVSALSHESLSNIRFHFAGTEGGITNDTVEALAHHHSADGGVFPALSLESDTHSPSHLLTLLLDHSFIISLSFTHSLKLT